MLWKVILSRGGKTCFVELKNDSIKPHSQHCDVNLLKTVLFLALNCLVNVSTLKSCHYTCGEMFFFPTCRIAVQ